jgi:hypothetical protein
MKCHIVVGSVTRSRIGYRNTSSEAAMQHGRSLGRPTSIPRKNVMSVHSPEKYRKITLTMKITFVVALIGRLPS